MINKSKRMVDIVSLGDLSHSAPGDAAVQIREKRFRASPLNLPFG